MAETRMIFREINGITIGTQQRQTIKAKMLNSEILDFEDVNFNFDFTQYNFNSYWNFPVKIEIKK